jgi:hypothetical protein
MRPDMDIGNAVQEMRAGAKVARKGWNGKGMYLSLVVPNKADHLPFVEMKTADGRFVPWLCSQTDLLAVDWVIAE